MRALMDDETRVHDGSPTTGPSRTLPDLAAVVPRNHVERARRRAETERADDPVSLAELLARYPRRRGVGKLRAILSEATFTAEAKSALEDRVLQRAGRRVVRITSRQLDHAEVGLMADLRALLSAAAAA